MSVQYWIIPSEKLCYMKVWGQVTIEEIMYKGASFFMDKDWENGFSLLLDYRKAVQLDFYLSDVRKLVLQDRMNDHLFDRSRCALVAERDNVYGMARMWEILSEQTRIEINVFRDIDKALDWLGLSSEILNSKDFYP